MLGRQSRHAVACFEGSFVGSDFLPDIDLTGRLPDARRPFNKEFVPILMAQKPNKTKVGAGLSCGMLWTVCQGMAQGDIVLCPDGSGDYHIGEVTGGYEFAGGEILPHRRRVRWRERTVARQDMTQSLQKSTGSIGTVSNVTKYGDEIESLIGEAPPPGVAAAGEAVEDSSTFALEKHLEDFLVGNWTQTELGRDYDIFEEEGEQIGQQYLTDTGPLDILAISKDRRTLLVVELKKGQASDKVVGQVLRYMGYVQDELAEDDQTVRGAVIALANHHKLDRALEMVPTVDFYRYEVSFKLVKA